MSALAIPWQPSRRTLRQFAGGWLVCVSLLAWRCGLASGAGVTLAGLAIVLGVGGLIRPKWIYWPFLALTVATLPLGWVISNILLAVVYYGLFTPVGLVFRLLGRDVLERRFCPERATYWETKPQPADVARYFRPF